MDLVKKRLGKNDIVFLIAAGLAAVIFLLAANCFSGGEGEMVVVTVNGEVYGTYPLDEEQQIEIIIDGVVSNVLSISDGKADMLEADCPDKLCVHQKAIAKRKETIVCLPNKVVVQVQGGEESEFDSVAK